MIDLLQTQIVKAIYFSGPQSIAEISVSIGKSVPIIAKTIQQLIDLNIIFIDGLRASTGGRRAAVYSVNKDKLGNILTLSINRYSFTLALYDIFNDPVSEYIEVKIKHLNDQSIFETIVTKAKSIIEQYNEYPIFAIGITTPGFVDSITGINNSYAKNSPLFDLSKNLSEALHIKCYIENDSSAIAIAEKHFGQAQNTKHSLIINLTWGVGLGIIVDQQLFRGYNGFAGEFSHIPLADENKLCSCGKKGCLEVEASLESAIEYIKDRLKDGEVSLLAPQIDNDDKSQLFNLLIQAYQQGDQLSIHAIKKIGFMLGKGIATLIHILNPEKVIISGIGSVFGGILLPEIQSSIHVFCIPRLSQRTTIQISNLNNIQPLASACVAMMQSESLI